MKKLSIIALLICALCMCSVAASAQVVVTPEMETKDLVSVQVTGTANANDKVTLLAIEGAMDTEGTTMLQQYTQENLAGLLEKVTYLDQKTAEDNKASFSFVPRDTEITDSTISFYASDGSTTAVNTLSTLMQYTVSFKSEGAVVGTTAVAEGTKLTDAIADASVADPSKFGYTFLGWAKESGEAFGDEDVVTGDAIVYAKWETNFALFQADTGYCTSGESAVKTGVVSVLAKVTQKEDKTVADAGFYVWRGNKGVEGSWLSLYQKETSLLNVGDNALFTLITDIPEANFAEGVVILPYANRGGARTFGTPQLVKLDGELKNLGDLDALKAELLEAAAK